MTDCLPVGWVDVQVCQYVHAPSQRGYSTWLSQHRAQVGENYTRVVFVGS